MKKMLVFGAGGHAKVIIDAARLAGFQVVGILDDQRALRSMHCEIPVVGCLADLVRVCAELEVDAGVVALGDNAAREQTVQRISALHPTFAFVSVVHPSAVIAQDVILGAGSVVMAGTVINPACNLGKHVIVNTNASLDHDCSLADFASVAPGATLGGKVAVGERSVISLGANVIHGVSIGADTVVGAGALVNRAVPDLVIAYGVPARVVRSRVRGEKYL